jgi:ABC-type glycerol-3-phosphate transport system substrate-binding protein
MTNNDDSDANSLDRRKYLMLSGGALTLAAGCAGQSENGNSGGGDADTNPDSQDASNGDDSSDSTTQITYYDRYDWCDGYSQQFNEESDSIEIETQVNPTTSGGAYQSAISQISAGNAPEVIGLDVVQIANFANLGALQDITSFTSNLEYREDIFDPLREDFVSYNDTTYAMPFWIDLSVYYYNKAHFEEVGLDPENPPKTWSEFLTANEQLTTSGRIGTASSYGGFFYLPTAWANGANLFSEDGSECVINSDAGIEALEFWAELNQSGNSTDLVSTEWQSAHDMFVSGDASIVTSGGYALGYTRDNNPKMIENGNLGVGLLPAPDSNTERTSFLGGNSIVITKQAKEEKLEAAKEFVRSVNTDSMMSVTLDNGYFPARSAGFELETAQENDDIFSSFETALAQGTAPPINPNYRAVSSALYSGMAPALNGDQSAESVLNDVVDRINNNVL